MKFYWYFNGITNLDKALEDLYKVLEVLCAEEKITGFPEDEPLRFDRGHITFSDPDNYTFEFWPADEGGYQCSPLKPERAAAVCAILLVVHKYYPEFRFIANPAPNPDHLQQCWVEARDLIKEVLGEDIKVPVFRRRDHVLEYEVG